ncbi:hypothetical protein ACVWYG_002035 [Pedobacter sp. UYEF25]
MKSGNWIAQYLNVSQNMAKLPILKKDGKKLEFRYPDTSLNILQMAGDNQ